MIKAQNNQRQIGLSAKGEVISIKIPIKIKRRGGRKVVILPEGCIKTSTVRDNTLVSALIRGHKWTKMIEQGRARSVMDLSEKEKVNSSYLSRIMRLTLLAPDIQKAILDGTQPRSLALADIMGPFPVEWEGQRVKFGF